MTRELRALTAARGIAAWWVVLYHVRLSIAGLPAGVRAAFAKGYLAVDFFFLLSGFVIWLSWHERLRAGGIAAAPGFLRQRLARIWPLHAVMLAGAVALAAVLAVTGRADPIDYPFDLLPLHVLLLQNWGFTGALAWNVPSWSISCELGAYLAFPLLALAIDWRRVPSAAVIAAGAAMLALLHGLMARAGAVTLGDDIVRLGLARCLCEFACGTTLGALWLRWDGSVRHPEPARHPGLVPGPTVPQAPATAPPAARWTPARGRGHGRVTGWCAVTIAAGLLMAWLTSTLPETLAIPAAFAALLLALALSSGARGNPLEIRPLHYLGAISYATYLSHYLLFVVFKLAFVSDPYAVPPALIALYFALVLGSSIALHHLVERPAQRWVNARRLPMPLTPRRAAPAAPRSPPC